MLPGAASWDFIAKLFVELATIFPDEYIHVGGDEADFCSNHEMQWKSAGMGTGAQFMKQVVAQAVAAGRKAVIWDDTMGAALQVRPKSQTGRSVQFGTQPTRLPRSSWPRSRNRVRVRQGRTWWCSGGAVMAQ